MIARGLLIRWEAQHGKDAEIEQTLRAALTDLAGEPATRVWFGVRFGRAEYGYFVGFADDASREAHLAGAVAKALHDRATALLAKPPETQKLTVLADKLPTSAPAEPDAKALLLTFKAKAGHEREVETFLRDAKAIVDDEPKTTTWFAFQLDHGEYGIFDTFHDNGGRFAHLTGHVPRQLAKHAPSLLGSVPDTELPQIIAEHLV